MVYVENCWKLNNLPILYILVLREIKVNVFGYVFGKIHYIAEAIKYEERNSKNLFLSTIFFKKTCKISKNVVDFLYRKFDTSVL